ncbi:hypothetical protein GLOIN_2v1785553 [Rhizophagus irregularis DAOM 181602=DAOM 197198]|nr:hypothetical protein GLOIN_2v1785553 [Rhizophagus irregularis DAOM 181602=DAOM 197198]
MERSLIVSYTQDYEMEHMLTKTKPIILLEMLRKTRNFTLRTNTTLFSQLTTKLKEVGDNANCDYFIQIKRITSLPCWSFLSNNWSSYSLVCGCLPSAFLEVLENLNIPRLTAMNVIAAIQNNLINKFWKRIWNLRSYDKESWEHVMNITSKLKNSSRPKGLPVCPNLRTYLICLYHF